MKLKFVMWVCAGLQCYFCICARALLCGDGADTLGLARPVLPEDAKTYHNAVQISFSPLSLSLSLDPWTLVTQTHGHYHNTRKSCANSTGYSCRALKTSKLSLSSFWSILQQKHTQEEWLCYLEIPASHSLSISHSAFSFHSVSLYSSSCAFVYFSLGDVHMHGGGVYMHFHKRTDADWL